MIFLRVLQKETHFSKVRILRVERILQQMLLQNGIKRLQGVAMPAAVFRFEIHVMKSS